MTLTSNTTLTASDERSARYFLNPTHNPLPPAFLLPRHLNPFYEDRVDLIPVPVFGSYVPNMKTAMVRWMLERAEAEGRLKGVDTLVEATSGNTGAALGILAPHYGIRRVVPVVERDIAPGKLEQLRLAGLDEPRYPEDGRTTIETAEQLGAQAGWLHLNQYANPANPEAHERWTGPHVWRQTGRSLSVFVAALGTTGTILGVGNFLRRRDARIAIIGIAVARGESVPGVRTEEKLRQVAFDWRNQLDDIVLASRTPSYSASIDLVKSGRMFGPSSGLALVGALAYIARNRRQATLDRLRNSSGRVVVAFACGDSPLPYLEKYSSISAPALVARGSGQVLAWAG